MAIGFKTYTPSGIEQLNILSPNLRVVATGTAGAAPNTGDFAIPDFFPESPIMLIKPAPGVFVGRATIFQRNQYFGNSFWYQSNGSFQWALCSTRGTPISVGTGKVGLKMWNPSGQLIFTPQWKYPRIQSLVSIASPPYSQSATSRSITFPSSGKMPWVIVQDIGFTYEASGGGSDSYPPYVYSFSINSAFNTLTVQMRNSDDFQPSGYSAGVDVFAGRLMRFPMCDIPGL